MAKADSIGTRRRVVISSLTKSGQWKRKLCIEDNAPARPSNVTFCKITKIIKQLFA
jgi:hypothetical protein